MKPKLPRALLWRDKDTMDELLKEPFGEELYQMFMSMARASRMHFHGMTYMPLLNEVYYQCTRVTYEKDPDAKVRDYSVDIKANIGGFKQTTQLVLFDCL